MKNKKSIALEQRAINRLLRMIIKKKTECIVQCYVPLVVYLK